MEAFSTDAMHLFAIIFALSLGTALASIPSRVKKESFVPTQTITITKPTCYPPPCAYCPSGYVNVMSTMANGCPMCGGCSYTGTTTASTTKPTCYPPPCAPCPSGYSNVMSTMTNGCPTCGGCSFTGTSSAFTTKPTCYLPPCAPCPSGYSNVMSTMTNGCPTCGGCSYTGGISPTLGPASPKITTTSKLYTPCPLRPCYLCPSTEVFTITTINGCGLCTCLPASSTGPLPTAPTLPPPVLTSKP